jgi:thioredoxin-related protein
MTKTVILWVSILVLATLSAFSTGGQHQSAAGVPAQSTAVVEGIHWLTWEEAMKKMEVEKKKMIVDLYTDWCGWCKRMDQTTFQNPVIVAYVNANYYAVKLNGEEEKPITVGDKTYEFVKSTATKGTKGYHELAQVLAMGRLSYPTIVFLNEEGNILQPIPGYKDATAFAMIMTYFGDNHYKSTPWDLYQQSYSPRKN